jgi:hypothetical protein
MVLSASRVSVPSDVFMREVAGESVILNLNTEIYFGLDEVGTRMWQVLIETETLQHAYEILLDEYDVEPDILRNDLIGLVEELASHGLIELHKA